MWRDGLTVSLVGTFNGEEKYSTSFVVDSTAPTFMLLNWIGIDTFSISSSGGTEVGYILPGLTTPGMGTHVVMDNLTVSSVPLPAALPLFGTALIGAGAFSGRRRKAK